MTFRTGRTTIVLGAVLGLAGILVPAAANAQMGNAAAEIAKYLDVLRRERVTAARAAVVKIINRSDERIRANGTGFIVGRKLHILTNYHVVLGADRLSVRHFASNELYDDAHVRIVGADPVRDIALLQLVGITPNPEISSLPLDLSQDLADRGISHDVDGERVSLPGTHFLVVANFAEGRNFLTAGVVGAIDTSRFLPFERGDRAHDYKVMLFENNITRGNSGAPILDLARGLVIGIATGAVGRDEYSGFGVPIRFALDLIAAAGDAALPVLTYFERFPDDSAGLRDRYYEEVATYSGGARKSVLVQVSMLDGTPLHGAWVTLSNGRQTYQGFTDETGVSLQELSLGAGSDWRLDVSHRAFDGLQRAVVFDSQAATQLEEVTLQLREEFRKPVLQFYVDPLTVGVHADDPPRLYARVSTGVRVTRSKTRWKVAESRSCRSGNEPGSWLTVEDTSGYTTPTGRDVYFGVNEQLPAAAYENACVDVSFVPIENNVEGVDVHCCEAQVRVFPGEVPAQKSIALLGFLQLVGGGWPGDEARVRAHVLRPDGAVGKPVSTQAHTDENGMFRLHLRSDLIPPDAQISLKVESSRFAAAEGIVYYGLQSIPENSIQFVDMVSK